MIIKERFNNSQRIGIYVHLPYTGSKWWNVVELNPQRGLYGHNVGEKMMGSKALDRLTTTRGLSYVYPLLRISFLTGLYGDAGQVSPNIPSQIVLDSL
jgi:hypothetical protein